jgi:hypothetical protein
VGFVTDEGGRAIVDTTLVATGMLADGTWESRRDGFLGSKVEIERRSARGVRFKNLKKWGLSPSEAFGGGGWGGR